MRKNMTGGLDRTDFNTSFMFLGDLMLIFFACLGLSATINGRKTLPELMTYNLNWLIKITSR